MLLNCEKFVLFNLRIGGIVLLMKWMKFLVIFVGIVVDCVVDVGIGLEVLLIVCICWCVVLVGMWFVVEDELVVGLLLEVVGG